MASAAASVLRGSALAAPSLAPRRAFSAALRRQQQLFSTRQQPSAASPSENRTSLIVRLPHNPGSLEEALRVFRRAQINLSRIESRPRDDDAFDIFLDVEGAHVPFQELRRLGFEVHTLGPKTVPWFPRSVYDLDSFSHKTLDAGNDLQSDHPGFSDTQYRSRRAEIVRSALDYRHGDPLPRVDYLASEVETWGQVYDELKKRYPRLACAEFNAILHELELCGMYSRARIPQMGELSAWLDEKTGFTLRPVGGLLSARDFLNGLAYRVFHSTQYMRHPSKPLYTPEPDAVHELMGHAPMLANEQFAAFSQELGLASLGASDGDIRRLATCYWFSVEFGLVEQGGQTRAFGAGLLSSFGELEFACSERAHVAPWNPELAAETPYPVTTFQPLYFCVPSLQAAAQSMRTFCEEGLKRPFRCRYDAKTRRVVTVDRQVRRAGSFVAQQLAPAAAGGV
jgi:phenylalanine-4-hydroxylase